MAGNDVHIPPESDDLIPMLIRDHLNCARESWSEQVERFAGLYQSSGLSSFWAIDTEEIREHLKAVPTELQNLYTKVWALHDVHRKKNQPDAKNLGDKTPLLSEWIDWLHIVSPNARYIYLSRNLFDTVASRQKAFGENLEASFNRVAFSWRKTQSFLHTYPESLKVVFYEDLVTSPEEELQSICQHLRISYHEKMLEPEKIRVVDEQLPHHSGLSRRIDGSSIGKAEGGFNPSELSWLKKQAAKYALPEQIWTSKEMKA